MRIIKQYPEDFIVKEVSVASVKEKGEYLYFWLRKKNYTTLEALEIIAAALRIPVIKFGYAGNKDRRAITEQLISLQGVKKYELEQLKLKDITITIEGYGEKYIALGDLKGNEFEIVVKNISNEEMSNFENKIKNKQLLMPNYYGEQRFLDKNIAVG